MDTLRSALKAPGDIADLLQGSVQQEGVERVLRAIRKHLGMDVAYVSHLREKDKIFEYADADRALPFPVGHVASLEEGYCRRIAMGELPELIPDTAANSTCTTIPETRSLRIAAHLGVPIRLHNGEIYGALCCLSHLPDPTLGERDLGVMRAFAEVLAAHFEEEARSAQIRSGKIRTLQQAMADTSLQIVYQPIYSLKTGSMVGVECLSRFSADALRQPHSWFELAEEVDLRPKLEVVAIRRALDTLSGFPDFLYFGLNSSPQTILSGDLAEALDGADLTRLVIEITEHDIVKDYACLSEVLRPLRKRGLRLAIDDAGAGYASLRHIVSLSPDIIKLDMSLVRNIDRDRVRRALAKALFAFSEEIDIRITAEGIETQGELDALRDLGVDNGQGYFLKEPVSLDAARQLPLHTGAVQPDQVP